MRLSILISGVAVLGVTILLLFDSAYIGATIFGFASGGLNLFLGIITRGAAGVNVPEDPKDPVKLSVDKGVIGATIYNMAFSDRKLVLKKLSSGRVTMLTVLLLAVLGFLAAFLLGVVEGGLTAFSVQEFLTQRKRNEIDEHNMLDASGKGDLEFPYKELEKVELTRNRLRLYLKNGLLRIVISRRYPAKMRPTLERIISSSER